MKRIVGLECIYICVLLIAQMFHSKISEKTEIKTIIKASTIIVKIEEKHIRNKARQGWFSRKQVNDQRLLLQLSQRTRKSILRRLKIGQFEHL